MDHKIIEDLVELGIYNSKSLTEEDYSALSKNNTNNSLNYITGHYEGGNEDYNKYFKEIDTKGLSLDEVKLQLEIDRAKNIRSIKNILLFFVVLIVVSLIAIFFFGISIYETIDKLNY